MFGPVRSDEHFLNEWQIANALIEDGTRSTQANRRLLVRMVSNACSTSEVTSLGIRFYVQLDRIFNHWPNRKK
jgi:hypothetical protein